MATSVVEGHRAAPLGMKRKWWSSGEARESEQRYSKVVYKGVNEQNQGLVAATRVKNLQTQKRVKTRKFKPKRRVPRSVPRAPFNDSSFLMRVRRSGGLASLVSPAPSSGFPSPAFSNLDSVAYKDFLDHEDYGYGSMTGLIRFRPREDEEETSGGATVANNFDDVNMCVEPRLAVSPTQNLEQRLDRLEMTNLPPRELKASQRVASQNSRIKFLEDENLVLKDRLFLVQQEVNELRERLQGGQSSNLILENDDSQSCLEQLS